MDITDEELDEFLLKLVVKLYYRERYMKRSPRAKVYHSAKWRAKKYGIDFTIKQEDVVIPRNCPYLGIPITSYRYAGRVDTAASLDRINPTKGYVPGNVQVISDLANRMKQDASVEQLLIFANNVKKLHQET